MKKIIILLMAFLLINTFAYAQFYGEIEPKSNNLKTLNCNPTVPCAFNHPVQVNDSLFYLRLRDDLRDHANFLLGLYDSNTNLTLESNKYVASGSDLSDGEIALVDDTHVVITYSGVGEDGYMRIMNWTQNLSTISPVTSYKFDSQKGQDIAIIKWDSSHFLMSYRGTDSNDGWSRIINFTDTYTMTTESYLEYDITYGSQQDLIKINDNYALNVYRDTSNNGVINILNIAGDYVITETDRETFDSSIGTPHIVLIDSNHAMLTYRDSIGEGKAMIINWDDSYNISKGINITFNSSSTYTVVEKVADDSVIVVWADSDLDGWLTGITWNQDFSNMSVVDEYEFDLAENRNPDIIKLENSNDILVAWTSVDDDGHAQIFTWKDCLPNWACNGYDSCNASDLSPCNNVTDLNVCGDNYTGDYSEFSPQACDYCIADIELYNQTDCITNYRTYCYVDNNFWTCCNMTNISEDCPQATEYECNQEQCIVFYEERDIPASLIDTIVKFILAIGFFITLLILIIIGRYLYKKVKSK